MPVTDKILYSTRITNYEFVKEHDQSAWEVVFCVSGLADDVTAYTVAINHIVAAYPTMTFVGKTLPIGYTTATLARGDLTDGYGAIAYVFARFYVDADNMDKCSAAARFGVDLSRSALDQASYGGGNESLQWYQTPFKASDSSYDNYDADGRPDGDSQRQGLHSTPVPYQLPISTFGISIPTILSEVAAENTPALDAYTLMLNMSKLVGTINEAITTSFQPTYSPGGWDDKKIRLDPFRAAYLGNGYWGVRWNATASPMRWQRQIWADVNTTENVFEIVDEYPLDTSRSAGRDLSTALPQHVIVVC